MAIVVWQPCSLWQMYVGQKAFELFIDFLYGVRSSKFVWTPLFTSVKICAQPIGARTLPSFCLFLSNIAHLQDHYTVFLSLHRRHLFAVLLQFLRLFHDKVWTYKIAWVRYVPLWISDYFQMQMLCCFAPLSFCGWSLCILPQHSIVIILYCTFHSIL